MKNRSVVSLVLAVFVVAMGMMSCGDDYEPYESFDFYEQYQKDSVIIDDYIAYNELDAYDVDSSGVYISIYHHGPEDSLMEHPSVSSDITIGYKGYLTNGNVFDRTAEGTTTSFNLSSLIPGWKIGIPEMAIGDSATLLIPSYWGYQNRSVGSIPANSVLIFDIYLDSFE